MSWFFYSKEGKLLYDVVAGSVGDADTLDGIDSTGFVQIGAPGLNVGDVDIDGSVTLPLNTVTDAGNPNTLDGTFRTVLVNSSSAPVTVTLPASPLTGQMYEIRDVGSTGAGAAATNAITVARNGNTIDGVASDLVVSTNGEGIVLVFNGGQWITLADRTISGGAVDADTLDGLDSLQFLRSDADDTAAGNITFSKSAYGPVSILDDTTNPNTLDDTNKTVVADPVTNGAPVTITLPVSPAVGQWYEIVDSNGGASTNNITIDPNGNFINTSGSNIVLDTDFDSIVLVAADATNWTIVAWRFAPTAIIPTELDDLSDVTIASPAEGEILRYNTPANQWINDPNATLDDSGSLHLPVSNSQVVFGENVGVGDEVSVGWAFPATFGIIGRTLHAGTSNHTYSVLENGVGPVVVDTYDVVMPQDNTLLCRTASGDLYVRLPVGTNTVANPVDGDHIIVKDIEGFAGANTLMLVAEGVRKRDLPLIQATSTTGTIANGCSTLTPGGIGTDEVQQALVTGSGTFEITFDGVETAAVLDETSTAAAVEAAINALSPHPNYGNFSVTVTGTDVTAGVSVTFDGGTLIDGEADYGLTVPWQGCKALFIQLPLFEGSWYLI